MMWNDFNGLERVNIDLESSKHLDLCLPSLLISPGFSSKRILDVSLLLMLIHYRIRHPLCSRCNVVVSDPTGLGLRWITVLRFFTGSSFNYKTNVRKFGPNLSLNIIWSLSSKTILHPCTDGYSLWPQIQYMIVIK